MGEIIFDKKELISVNTDTKIEEVAKIMKDRDILSVPVWDNAKHQYVGLLDVFEIMRFTAAGFFEESVFKDDLFTKFEWSVETAGDLVAKSSRAKRIAVMSATDPLKSAIRALSDVDHRALVHIPMDEKTFQPSYRMVSQMDVVRYIFKHIDDPTFKNCTSKRIEEMGLVNPLGNAVISVTTQDRAATAFYRMFYNQVNAVAVVDEAGKLVANISASDLRGLSSATLPYLRLPALEFLKKMAEGKKPAHVLSCYSHELLSGVISKVVTANVHRVWVINAAQNPIGVVTLTDIISTFVPTPAQSK